MASEGGGKMKSKRMQASSKPYERKSSSLFGKLKNSVKDLLIPSWLSRSSTVVGEREASGSSDDQALSSSAGPSGHGVIPQPQQSSGPHHHLGGGMNAMEQSQAFVDLTQDHIGQHLPGFPSHGQAANSHIGLLGMDSSYGEPVPNVNIATLGRQSEDCRSKKPNVSVASRIPVPSSRYSRPSTTVRDPVRLRMSDSYLDDTDDQESVTQHVGPIMVSTGSHSRSPQQSNRQRLWSPETARKGRPLVPPATEKPAFNSLLFGSLNKSDTSMFGESFRESTFYPGKTRFGGAAGERRKSLNTSLPYQSSLPLRKQVRATKPNSSFHATTSSTAQRILETLDRMSTPLGDAKKIPQAESANDSVLSFTPSSYRRTSLIGSNRPITRPLQIPNRGPPTSQHQTLSQAVIAKNRNRTGVVDKRLNASGSGEGEEELAPRTGLAVSQEPSALRPSHAASGSGMGKMKTKRFSQHVSSGRVTEDDEVVEVPNLRTDFTLPISNMAPISLPSLPVKSHTVATASIPASDKAAPLKFTFSTPIEEKRRPASNQDFHPTGKGFKFSFPIKATQSKANAAGAEEGSKTSPEPAVGASSGVSSAVPSAAFSLPVRTWGSVAPKPKTASPDIGGTSSSFKSYSKWDSCDKHNGDSSAASDVASPAGFTLAPAVSLKSGSVMDILGKTSSPLSTSSTSPSSTPKTAAPTVPAAGTDDLMAKFRPAPGTWECDTCMLFNKPEATKCVACEALKPGSKATAQTAPQCSDAMSSQKPATATAPAVGTDDLMAKFRPAQGTWECDTCMLFNKPEASKCVACEAPKPGVKTTAQTAAAPGPSSNNIPLSELFKKPPGSWECDTCMVQNTATALRCIACESPKPGLKDAGIVSKAADSSSSSQQSVISISPAGGFKINITATTTTTTGSGGFRFGNTNSSSSATPATSLPPPTGFVFGQTSASSGSSSTSVPLSSGFKFGATSSGSSDSSGSAGGTLSKGGSGFVFGNTSTKSVPPTSSNTSSGFQFGAPLKSSESDSSSSNSGPSVLGSATAASPSGSLSNGSAATDLNRSNNFVAPSGTSFQFGSTASTQASAPLLSGVSAQSASTMESAIKPAQQQISFNFGSAAGAATPSAVTTMSKPGEQQTQSSEKSDSSTSAGVKPASTPFQFGLIPAGATTVGGPGLGLGKSDSKPMVNGGFGSGLEMQTTKDSSKPASTGGFSFNAAAPAAPVFGGFSQPAGTAAPQSSQPVKRSVDCVEMGAPSAKKSFSFGGSSSEPSTNGIFHFGGQSQVKAPSFGSSAAPAAGSFAFGSNAGPATSANAPAPTGGFQFAAGQSGTSAASGFNFSFKTQNDSGKAVTDFSVQPTSGKGGITFNVTPNFNFSGSSQQQTGVPFQFSAQPTENSSPALPVFGAAPTPGVSTDGPGFTFGSGGGMPLGGPHAERKIKRAVRRTKK